MDCAVSLPGAGSYALAGHRRRAIFQSSLTTLCAEGPRPPPGREKSSRINELLLLIVAYAVGTWGINFGEACNRVRAFALGNGLTLIAPQARAYFTVGLGLEPWARGDQMSSVGKEPSVERQVQLMMHPELMTEAERADKRARDAEGDKQIAKYRRQRRWDYLSSKEFRAEVFGTLAFFAVLALGIFGIHDSAIATIYCLITAAAVAGFVRKCWD
jgi:hypothetical protein